MEKLRLFKDINTIIMDSIGQFWEGIDVDSEDLTVAADQMILIYLFIVVRSKLSNFYSHIMFIQEFTTKYIKQISLGYFLTTYEMALITLIDSDDEKLKSLINLKVNLEPPKQRSESIIVGSVAFGGVLH